MCLFYPEHHRTTKRCAIIIIIIIIIIVCMVTFLLKQVLSENGREGCGSVSRVLTADLFGERFYCADVTEQNV
jgi:uncharacterized membrane protein